jgi:endonuclease YncB( thermonuclease family)
MRIYDSGSFLLNDDILILEGIVPLPPRQICTDAAGKKSACGARSIQALRRALSGKFVECSRKPLALHVYLVDCTVNGKRIAETLLQQGAGHAAR